ncbi:MAG TPA: protein kinase [Bacteroidota bacterium]
MPNLIGQTVSHYRILEQLGAGGMGVVYRAEDLLLGRNVALKFLPPDLTQDPHAKARFVREARAASALDHPNICTIYEVGETADGQTFIAMACYGGETLMQKVSRGQLGFDDVTSIARQVAMGLAKAHEKGIVHRDLNPNNIMITEEGVVKVLDFGLAKLAGQSRTTKVGSTAGTVPYMSPEQIMGIDTNAATDVWSLGVVVYQMLCGSLPFRGEYPPAQMYAITNEPAPAMDKIRPGVPAALTTLVEQSLQKDPARRTCSMPDIVRFLDPKSADVVSDGFVHHSNYLWLAAVAVLLLLVAGAAILSVTHQRLPSTTGASVARARIGVLPFQSPPGDTLAGRWPLLIQSLLVAQLTGTEHIGVVPPGTLRSILEKHSQDVPPHQGEKTISLLLEKAGVTYVLDGTIARSIAGYRIQADLIHAADGEVHYSTHVEATQESDLEQAIPALGEKILDFFEVEKLHSNTDEALQPWFRRRSHNLEAERSFLEASELLYQGGSGSAVLLQRALQIDSTFVSPRVWLLSGLVANGKRDEASRHYRVLASLRANPFERAMIQWCGAAIQGDLVGEVRALNAALQYSPGNNILLLNLAEAHDGLGDPRAALDALLPALGMGWRFPPAYSDAARYYVELGMYDEASRVLDEACSRGLSRPEICSMLSALALIKGDTVGSDGYAATAIRRFQEFDGRMQQLEYMMGTDLFSTGSYARSAIYFRKAALSDPSVPSYRSGLGDALYGTGDSEGAGREFSEVLRLDSTWAHAHLMLAMIAEQRGDNLDAAQHFGVFLSRQPAGRIADTVRQHIAQFGNRHQSL